MVVLARIFCKFGQPPGSPPQRQYIQPGDRIWVNLHKDFGEVVSIKKGNAELLMRNKRLVVLVATLEKNEPLIEKLSKGVL